MCLLASVYLLWKNVDSDLLGIFKSSFLFFWYWSIWAIYNFWILTSTEWEKIFANVSLFFFFLGDRNTPLMMDVVLQVLIWWEVSLGHPISSQSLHVTRPTSSLKPPQSLLQRPGCWTPWWSPCSDPDPSLHHFSGHILAELLLNWEVLGLVEAIGLLGHENESHLRIEILWITAKENKKQTNVQLQNEGDLAVMFVKCFRGY